MPGLPDCPGCEFSDDPGHLCHSAASGVARYCRLIHAEGREDYRRLVREWTLDGPPPAVPMSIDPVSLAVETCLFAEGCGCGGRARLCSLATFPVPVSLSICRACSLVTPA